jgi:adenylate kinase family enzyme
MVNDSFIFEVAPKDFSSNKKVVITAGSPGAGKSTVSKLILGGLGFSDRDVDDMLKSLLKREKMGLDMSKYSSEEEKKKDDLRNKTFSWIEKSQEQDVKQGKGIIVNTTGANYDFTISLKKKFEDAGYSVKMLFVDASLETSLKRNSERERSLNPQMLKQKHKEVENNIEKFKKAFGGDFHYYLNDEGKEASLRNKEIVKISKDFVNWRPSRNN